MKKLLFIALMVGSIGYVKPTWLLNFLPFGKSAYGMSKDDPLGTPAKINKVLLNSGFHVSKSGRPGKPRTLEYISDYDKKNDPEFTNLVKVDIGDDEYVQSVSAIFVSTQHGYSPQRKTATEAFMGDYWATATGSKPNYEAKSQPISMPYGLTLADNYMQAKFSGGDVKGKWLYSEHSPSEVAVVELK